jgi:protein translocase SEC61 complex gamma subunit
MDEKKSLADANKDSDVNKDKNTTVKEEVLHDSKVKADIEKEAEETKEKPATASVETKSRVEMKVNEIAQKSEKQKEQPHLEQVKHRGNSHTLSKIVRKITSFRPHHVKEKIAHYWTEYSRVLRLSRKPTRTEYRELAIMVIVGTAIIGAIGFVVQIIMQFI